MFLRKWLFLAMVAVFFAGILPVWAVPQEGTGGLRYTIAVSSFENRANLRGLVELGDAWGAVMTDALNQTGRFIVLGERDMRADAAAESGRRSPAQLLVKGVVTHVQNTNSNGGGFAIGGLVLGGSGGSTEMNITMYLVDTETGQVLASTSVVGKSKSGGVFIGTSHVAFGTHSKDNTGKALENAIAQGVNWMMEQLPKIKWSGSVVLNNDSGIYINRGQREGVQPGQEFVVGNTEVLRDPTTGEVLDEILHESAKVRVITAKEKVSVCEIISGSDVEVGMRVFLP